MFFSAIYTEICIIFISWVLGYACFQLTFLQTTGCVLIGIILVNFHWKLFEIVDAIKKVKR